MYCVNIEVVATACAAVRRLLVATVTRNPHGVRSAAKIGGKLRLKINGDNVELEGIHNHNVSPFNLKSYRRKSAITPFTPIRPRRAVSV